METGSNYTLKCPQNQFDNPPYRTKAVFRYDNNMSRPACLFGRTLCMSSEQGEINPKIDQPKYRHYDVHKYVIAFQLSDRYIESSLQSLWLE